MAKKLQSGEVEECKECYIEILNSTGTFLDGTGEADALTSLASGASEGPPALIPIQADYCPQSASMSVPLEGPRLVRPPASSSCFSQREADSSEDTDVERDETV